MARKRSQRRVIYAASAMVILILGMVAFKFHIVAAQERAQGVKKQQMLQSASNKIKAVETEQKALEKQNTDLETKIQTDYVPKAQHDQEVEGLKQEVEAAKQSAAARKAAIATYAVASKPAVITYGGSHEDWMAAAGIAASDYGYVDYIVSHEGGWGGVQVYNRGGSGAYGLCQSLPGNKMASAGTDWATNPVTQLRWCASYAAGKGGWRASYLLWISQQWW